MKLFKYIPAIILLLAVAGCDKKLPEELRTAGFRQLDSAPDTLIISDSANRVVLRAGSSAAIINGVPLQLPAAVQCDGDSNWAVPADAIKWTILPVLENRRRQCRTILIDPGHGGSDPGAAAVNKKLEKDLNLALALRIGKSLQSRGYRVLFTRTDDRFIPLETRAQLAERLNADLFISVHHNSSAVNAQASGMETFALRPENIEERRYVPASLRFAYLVQRALSRRAPSIVNRGVKSARFKVLRLAKCPAVLIEAGFISNPSEAGRCASAAGMHSVADAVAGALADY